MFITRRTLENAGLEVHLDKHGLHIGGNAPFPQEAREHLDAVANLMQFQPSDHDNLIDHVANVGIWNALRACPTKV